jgi:hypothetical protein
MEVGFWAGLSKFGQAIETSTPAAGAGPRRTVPVKVPACAVDVKLSAKPMLHASKPFMGVSDPGS